MKEAVKIRGSISLTEKCPELIEEWNYEKNEKKPEAYSYGSNKKVWWLCASGHEWKADISHRAGGCGCPICSNQKVLPGYNDLATKHPELIKEWNYLKNGELKPSDITPGSGKKVWWLCELGHEWKSDVSNRIQVQNCPICSGRRILSGYNDLATKYPKLEKQWDFIKNGTLTPYNVGAGSNKKVWWKCELGHEWEASISNRVKGCGCSVCSGRKVLVGYNDLASKYPVIAKQWHPNKNGSLTPYDITSGSQRKVWWKCASGHEWEAQICNRVNGRGCPICSNKKVLLGYNDLASKYPVIAKQWHPDKNGVLTPYDITVGSGKEVWWICELGHEWKEPVRDRTKGSGCRICLTKKNTNQKIQPISRLEPSSKSEALIVS